MIVVESLDTALHARHFRAIQTSKRAANIVGSIITSIFDTLMAETRRLHEAKKTNYLNARRRLDPILAPLADRLVASTEALLARFAPVAFATAAQAMLGAAPDAVLSILAGDPVHEARRRVGLTGLAAKARRLQKLTAAEIAAIIKQPVAGGRWQDRMRKWSRLVTDHEQLAHRIATGLANGQKPSEIRKAILPLVNNLKTSATRIVRNEILRVSHATQDIVWERTRTVIAGAVMQSQYDDRVRQDHAARAGAFYSTEPGSAFSFDSRPRLPDAPNCRCYYTIRFKTAGDRQKPEQPPPAPPPSPKKSDGVHSTKDERDAIRFETSTAQKLNKYATGDRLHAEILKAYKSADKLQTNLDLARKRINETNVKTDVANGAIYNARRAYERSPTAAAKREYDAAVKRFKDLETLSARQRKTYSKLHQSIEKSQADARAAAEKILGVREADRSAIQLKSAGGVTAETDKDTRDVLKWLSKMTGKREWDFYGQKFGQLSLELNQLPADGRAFHRGGRIFIAKGEDKPTIAHEIGHAYEQQSPKGAAIGEDFRKHRLGAAARRQSMKSIFPQSGYNVDEFTDGDDDWLKTFKAFGYDDDRARKHAFYAGKTYDGKATELISMGLELLYKNPGLFAKSDKEWFKLTVGFLRGDIE